MMNDLEEIWEQSFSQLGYKLDLVKPNYHYCPVKVDK